MERVLAWGIFEALGSSEAGNLGFKVDTGRCLLYPNGMKEPDLISALEVHRKSLKVEEGVVLIPMNNERRVLFGESVRVTVVQSDYDEWAAKGLSMVRLETEKTVLTYVGAKELKFPFSQNVEYCCLVPELETLDKHGYLSMMSNSETYNMIDMLARFKQLGGPFTQAGTQIWLVGEVPTGAFDVTTWVKLENVKALNENIETHKKSNSWSGMFFGGVRRVFASVWGGASPDVPVAPLPESLLDYVMRNGGTGTQAMVLSNYFRDEPEFVRTLWKETTDKTDFWKALISASFIAFGEPPQEPYKFSREDFISITHHIKTKHFNFDRESGKAVIKGAIQKSQLPMFQGPQ